MEKLPFVGGHSGSIAQFGGAADNVFSVVQIP